MPATCRQTLNPIFPSNPTLQCQSKNVQVLRVTSVAVLQICVLACSEGGREFSCTSRSQFCKPVALRSRCRFHSSEGMCIGKHAEERRRKGEKRREKERKKKTKEDAKLKTCRQRAAGHPRIGPPADGLLRRMWPLSSQRRRVSVQIRQRQEGGGHAQPGPETHFSATHGRRMHVAAKLWGANNRLLCKS